MPRCRKRTKTIHTMEAETSSAEDGATQGNKKERVKARTVVSKTGTRLMIDITLMIILPWGTISNQKSLIFNWVVPQHRTILL
jgi:hypothetical protein